MILSVLYFFFIIVMYGLSLNYILSLKNKLDNLEGIVIIFSLGLGVFVVLSNLLNILRVPLHWLVFLIISIIIPIYSLLKNRKLEKIKFKFSFKKDYPILIAIVLGLILFFVYFQGGLRYPYLENDDPWSHAMVAKYISIEKTAFEPSHFDFQYIDPYPSSFSIMMGVLHQLNDSIYLTLNLFNSLLCGLAIIFFFLFARKIFENDKLSLLATFLIFSLPSFMSHFIWSQTLALTFFFPAWFFLLDGIKTQDKKSFFLAGIFSSSVLLSQPSTSFNYVIMTAILVLFYFMSDLYLFFSKKENVKKLKTKIINYGLFLLTIIIFAGFYWLTMIFIYGVSGTIEGIGFSLHHTVGEGDTSGGIVYTLKDFIFAPKSSKMDQATGLGWMIFLLLIPGFFNLIKKIKEKKTRTISIIILVWLIFAVLGVQGNALPIKLFPHRFWAFLAIPIVIIGTLGIESISKKINDKSVRYFIITIIIVGVLFSSAYPKHVVQTSHWPPGVRFTSYEEVAIYSKILTEFPKNQRIFMLTPAEDSHIIGVDQFSESWKKEIVDFRKDLINKNLSDLYLFLKKNNYDYIIIGGMSMREMSVQFGANETQEYFNNLFIDLQNTTKFSVVFQNQGAVLLSVN